MVSLHQIFNGVRFFRELVTACHESRGILHVKRLAGKQAPSTGYRTELQPPSRGSVARLALAEP
jgi:hypothetical protein